MTPAIGVAGRIRAALATTARAARLRPLPVDVRQRIADLVGNLSCRVAREVTDLDESMDAMTVAEQQQLLLYRIAAMREIISVAKAQQRELLKMADQQKLTDEQIGQVCGVTHQAIGAQRQRARQRKR